MTAKFLKTICKTLFDNLYMGFPHLLENVTEARILNAPPQPGSTNPNLCMVTSRIPRHYWYIAQGVS